MNRFLKLLGLTVFSLSLPITSHGKIETYFEGGFRNADSAEGAPGKAKGQLAWPFVDDASHWDKRIDWEFEKLTSDPFSGGASQRITVNPNSTSVGYMRFQDLGWPQQALVKFRAAFRSPASTNVEFIVRQNRSPYHVIWRKPVAIVPEWRIVEFVVPRFDLKGADYSMFLLFSKGTVDIDELSIEELDISEFADSAAELKGQNLLMSSSFPMGLHRPWSLDPNHHEAVVEADPNVIGPTGISALRLEPTDTYHGARKVTRTTLQVPPFPVAQTQTHTLSFYAKGSQPGQKLTVNFIDQGRALMWEPVTLSTEWKRYHVTKELPFMVEGFGTARIFSGETFWLDGLQFEVGEEPTEFKRVNQAELVLETVRPLGLSVEDESIGVNAAAYGDVPEGSYLEGNYLDSYGNEVPITALANQSTNGEVMTLNLPEHPASKYGTFQLALRLYDAEGNAISDWAEVLLHRVHKPRMWGKDAPDSPFGVHIHSDERWAKIAKQLGYNWARAHGGTNAGKWYLVEPEPGVFDFSSTDEQIRALRSQDLMVLGMIDTTPVWYSEGTDRERFHDPYYLPKAEFMDNWSDYAKRVVERYKDQVAHWEIWNEPYVKSFFRLHDTEKGQYKSGAPSDYQPLLETAYAAVKEANPEATVIWSSTHSEFWYAGTAAEGAYNFADETSFHFYSSGSPFPDFDTMMANMRSVMPEEKRGMPISNTEGGTGGANDLSLYRYIDSKPATAENTYQHAEYMVLYQLAGVVHGVERFFLYTLHAWTWAAGWDIMMPDGSLPPSATAMSTLFWHVEGKEFVEEVDLGTHIAYVFDGKREDSIVLRRKSGVGSAELDIPKLPKKAVFRDFYGNERKLPVLKQDLVSYITCKDAKKVIKLLKQD